MSSLVMNTAKRLGKKEERERDRERFHSQMAN